MMRLGAAFVAVCMVLIAGSLGAILYLWVGLSAIEAIIAAMAVLTAMVVYNTASTRISDQDVVGQQIADLSRGTADLARQVGEIGRRIEAAESAVATAVEKTRAATSPLTSEIETLGTLVKQLAESVAAHEAVLSHAAESLAAGGVTPGSTAAGVTPPYGAPSYAPSPYAGLAGSGDPDTFTPPAIAGTRLTAAEPVLERMASGRFRGLDRAH